MKILSVYVGFHPTYESYVDKEFDRPLNDHSIKQTYKNYDYYATEVNNKL